MAKYKISRKELRDDKLVDILTLLNRFIRKYKKWIYPGAGFFIALTLVITLLQVNSLKKEKASLIALYSSQPLFQTGDEKEIGKTLKSLEELVKEYPGTSGEERALYYLGNLYWELKEYEKAKESYENYLKKYPRGIFALQAQEGIGYCWEGLKDFAKALDSYKKARDRFPSHYLAPQIEMDIARIYKILGNYPQAEKVYQGIITSSPNSPWADKAAEALELIAGKSPTPTKEPS